MKKAYLSIGALLAVLAIGGCNIQGGNTSSSTEASSSGASSVEESSSREDVFHYELAVTAPTVTTYEVGDVFDFASINVVLTTYKNDDKQGDTTLARADYDVKVNGQVIEGNFTFTAAGEIEFEVSSKAHPSATKTFKVTAEQHFTITNGSSDKVVLASLPARALPGDTISFELTLLPGYYFEGTLHILDNEGNEVEYTDNGNYGYSFTMPSSNVVITVTTDMTDFTISKDDDLIGNIVLESAEDESTPVYSAVAGTELKFKADANHPDYVFTKIYVGGEEKSIGDDGYYHFTMPHHPIVINADKAPREYDLVTNAEDLTLATLAMYTDPETKAPVTSAHKGQTVYLEMSYSARLVKFSVSVMDLDGSSIAVTQDENNANLFSFVMTSSEMTIDITEDDWSLYAGYYVTDKVWRGISTYDSSYNKLETKTYDTMLSESYWYTFNGNGKGTKGSTETTWSTTVGSSRTNGLINIAYSNYTDKAFYFTPSLFATKCYDSPTYDWTNVAIGTWDENATVHVLTIGARHLAWVEDEYGYITDKILTDKDGVYTDFGLYTDETKSTLVKGSDITTTLNAYVEVNSSYKFELVNGKVIMPYSLNAAADSSYSIVFKDADGKAITEAKNGTTVYMYATLSSELDSDISIKAANVTYGSSKRSVTLTAVTGEENVWSFEMPEGEVDASLTLYNPNKMAGHAALGTYYGFNFYSSYAKDTDYSSKSLTTYSLDKAGVFKEGTTSFEVNTYDETARGTFTAVGSYNTRVWSYGENVIARPYGSSYNDVYVAVRVSDTQDYKKVQLKAHWMSSGSSWAIEYHYVDGESDTILGGIFQTGNKFYMGVTFEMTGDSTRIESGATYNVKMDGETIFTVANNSVTAAE